MCLTQDNNEKCKHVLFRLRLSSMFSKPRYFRGSFFFPVFLSLTTKKANHNKSSSESLELLSATVSHQIQLECGISWSNFVLSKCTSTHHTQYIWKWFWQHLGRCDHLHVTTGTTSPNKPHDGGFCPLLFQENGGQNLVADPPHVFFCALVSSEVLWYSQPGPWPSAFKTVQVILPGPPRLMLVYISIQNISVVIGAFQELDH